MSATTPRTSTVTSRPGGAPGRHRSRMSRWRRAALVVLSAGAVLSLGAAFGPVWLVRAGVLAALLTAVLVHRFARAEVSEAHDDHARRSSRAAADHRSAVEREQRRQQQSTAQAEGTAAVLRARIDDLEHQVVGLHADLVAASAVNHRLEVAAQLLEAENGGLRAAAADTAEQSDDTTGADPAVADVRPLPRRIRRNETPAPEPGWDNLEVDVAVTG